MRRGRKTRRRCSSMGSFPGRLAVVPKKPLPAVAALLGIGASLLAAQLGEVQLNLAGADDQLALVVTAAVRLPLVGTLIAPRVAPSVLCTQTLARKPQSFLRLRANCSGAFNRPLPFVNGIESRVRRHLTPEVYHAHVPRYFFCSGSESASMRAISSALSSTSAASPFSTRRARLRMPGIGTI